MSAPLTSPGGVVRPFGWSHFRSFGASSWIFACLLLCTLFLGIFALGLRPKSSFWPLRGHIFSSVFSPGLWLSFTFAASRVLFSFVFLSRRPVSLFLSFSLGASFPLFLWFLSRFCSLPYFIRFIWVLSFCGYFLIYFYFIFIFFYLSAYRYEEGKGRRRHYISSGMIGGDGSWW